MTSISRVLYQVGTWKPDDDILNDLQKLKFPPDGPYMTLNKVLAISDEMRKAMILLKPQAIAWAKIQARQFAQQPIKSCWADGIARLVVRRALAGLKKVLEKQFPGKDYQNSIKYAIWRNETPFLYYLKNELKETIIKGQAQADKGKMAQIDGLKV